MPMDNRTYLGIRIHDARKACNLTQQELSDETGVSIKMIQCIESGKVNPSF
ncbi:MAG: helix-turn-helix domain-containing protein, partial [Oscillospiraceae bacterium]|nr:helix-turn-helix domain-containing protein [Oscillospiraceae bacterium]